MRFIKGPDEIEWDGLTPRINPEKFPSADVRGEKQKDKSRRSVSTFRFELTPIQVLHARAKRHNEFNEWNDDPVIALASVSSVRKVLDDSKRREFCVYAEPLDEPGDPLGPCPTHAGIKQSKPERLKMKRPDIAVLRGQIAGTFDPLVHIVSRTQL